MKRFQECNKIHKLWRYRWYILIPFIFIWKYFNKEKVYLDDVVDNKIIHTDTFEILKPNMLWCIIKGKIQFKMNWYYTNDEVFNKI